MRTRLILAGILLVALLLRLWNLDHGLPFAYNADEAEHFVPKAVGMFDDGLDPGYYENPSALTYLLFLVYGVGQVRDLGDTAFLTARVVVALIGTGVVALVYWAGTRFFERRVGLAIEGRMPAREGAVIFVGEKQAGVITSGGFSPSLERPIAMGWVDAALAEPGTAVEIEVRGKRIAATVTPMPFVPHKYVRKGS